ncbi:MFS transporter [Aliiglaciecola litoralis]|uniref:MFS transporter n=1 Tax=Aliiglaciecola litoralis TaxID=582857 RepID=A0ABN1LKJ7_9ALTE
MSKQTTAAQSSKRPSEDLEHAPIQSSPVSQKYRIYVLVILTLVYAFNFIDRQIIGILSPLIQQDLGLDDAQMGWLKGIYFALLYTVLGIPIAWLADRYNRVNIIAISLTIWSGFTALSGLASNYMQLALARAGVGIGEAGGSPPSHSIISDLFPKDKRASALSIYSLGIPFGIMLAFFATAFLIKGGSADWRVVMLSVGLPGVALAIILKLTVKEPVRGGDNAGADLTQVPFSQALKTLLSIPSWWGMCLGISFGSFANYAIGTWIIDFYVRAHSGLDFVNLLVVMGIINGTAYALGVWVGGVLVDKWSQRSKKAYGLVPGLMLVIATPAFMFSLYVESLNASLALMTIVLFASGSYLGPSFALAQTLAPVKVRAMSTALLFFVLNIIGLGGGPTFVGLLSDAFSDTHGSVEGLRLAMTWLAAPFILSILAYFWTSRKVDQDWQNAEQRNG